MARPRIPTDRILGAALAIVDEEGPDALSMRSLAGRLGSSTATLYRHFPNRSALVGAVIDRVIGEVDVGGLIGPWREVCTAIATGYYDALQRHNGVALLLIDHTPDGPNGAVLADRWLSALLADGFPVEVAARSGAMMSSYVLGFAIQRAGQRATAGTEEELLLAAKRRMDPEKFPATMIAVRAGVLPVSLEDEFAFGLTLIIEGLERLRTGT